jgi:hypothetical protein
MSLTGLGVAGHDDAGMGSRKVRRQGWTRRAALFAVAAPCALLLACVPDYKFPDQGGDGGPPASDGAAPGRDAPPAALDAPPGPHDASSDAPPAPLGDSAGDGPAPPPAVTHIFVNIDTYSGGICALRGASLYCWGDPTANGYGELGFALGDAPSAPVFPTVTPTTGTPSIVAMGQDHTCSLYGRIAYCRGRNEGYQRGNISMGNGPAETPVLNLPAGGLDTIAASDWTTCGLVLGQPSGPTSNVYCWGWNNEGECGRPLNDAHDPNTAWPLTGEIDGGPTGVIHDATAIAGGGLHFCAITARNTVECWGSTTFLESGPSTVRACPGSYAVDCSDQPQEFTLPNQDPPVQIAVGDRHSCALGQSGNVYCWGADEENQLGQGAAAPPQSCKDGNMTPFSCSGVPLQVQGLAPMKRLFAGGDDTCALDAAGHAYCWGMNDNGELGVGDTAVHAGPTEVVDEQTSQALVFDEMALGGQKVCGRSGPSVLCWGQPNLGTGAPDGATSNTAWPSPVHF